MAENDITQDLLRRLFSYDSKTCLFRWQERPSSDFSDANGRAQRSAKSWNTRYADKIAGYVEEKGYRWISINGVIYQFHRLVWLYVYGEWPNQIDHVFGIEISDHIDDMRNVNNAENGKNCKLSIRNKSGVVGVAWHKRSNKWIAKIMVDCKSIYLGVFTEKSDAIAARKAAEIRYGFHPNHGRKT